MTALRLHIGNCLEVLKGYPDNSFDAVVTDPPYHLTAGKKGGTGVASLNLNSPAGRARISTGFMGQAWDGGDIAFRPELWLEVLRVLKPGGHVAAFGGTRTYHRLACAIEDAGFEIRDSINWVFGSGFPKSKQVSVAIDDYLGVEREVIGHKKGVGGENLNDIVNGRDVRSTDDEGGKGIGAYGVGAKQIQVDVPITAPGSPEAKKYDGWGTALKPAHEPIVIARKPLEGTVAENVLVHGTGGINIDGCRVPTNGESYVINRFDDGAKPFGGGAGHAYSSTRVGEASAERTYTEEGSTNFAMKPGPRGGADLGRWPANIVITPETEVLAAFPDAKGAQCVVRSDQESSLTNVAYNPRERVTSLEPREETESASRYFNQFPYSEEDAQSFFYCAKAARKEREAGLDALPSRSGAEAVEREEGSAGMNNPRAGAGRTASAVRNHHPTVKPIALMSWLVRLLTPPGGCVLDPFMGSGSTGVAAVKEGFGFVGIDLDPEFVTIAQHRIAHAVKT